MPGLDTMLAAMWSCWQRAIWAQWYPSNVFATSTQGLSLFQRDWKRLESHIGTKTAVQVRGWVIQT
jgi:hypothetical protein